MQKLTLALDWTPNINHIGFFVARDKGFFKNNGIDIDILNPSDDDYQVTPAKKVELGLAQFALCPTESIISYQTKSNPFDLVAVAAILQEDLSAIAVNKASNINTPKDLNKKTYSSYKARYEDGIVKEMIKNDGGKGELEITYPDKLGIWNTLLNGEADATWVFLNWEGIEAKEFSDRLKYFKMKDYEIPYSYSPVIATSLSKAKENLDTYKAFLQASKEGYLYCQNNSEEAVEILSKYIAKSDQKIDLNAALTMSHPHFGNKTDWGVIDNSVITKFLDWLKSTNLESSSIRSKDVYTNEFLF